MDIMENEPLYAPDAANPGQITVAATSITPHTSASAAEEEEVEVVAEEVEVEPMIGGAGAGGGGGRGADARAIQHEHRLQGRSRVAQPFKHGKQFWRSKVVVRPRAWATMTAEWRLVVARATASAAAPPPQGDALVGMTVEVK